MRVKCDRSSSKWFLYWLALQIPHLQAMHALQFHGVVLETHRVLLLEHWLEEILNFLVIGGLDDELVAVAHVLDVAFLDGDLAGLDNISRVAEHVLAVGILIEDRDI